MRTAIALVIAALATACTEPDNREFIIRADSVVTPGAWSGGAPMKTYVYARVGPNSCWSFKEFRVESDTHLARVKIIGTHVDGPGVGCRAMPTSMNGTELVIQPYMLDPFELRILQPDGTTLSKTIRME